MRVREEGFSGEGNALATRGGVSIVIALADGRSAFIDEGYLIESILQPEAKRVAGFDEAAMPSYEGLVSMQEAEKLAQYIMSLR